MRLTVALLFLALLVTIAACTNGDPKTPTNREAFVGGTQAIKLSFIPNAPPPEVVDKTSDGEVFEFPIIVNAENVGEHAMHPNNFVIKITGFLPNDFGVGDPDLLTRPLNSVGGHRNGELFQSVRKDPEGNAIQGEVVQFEFPMGETPFFFDKTLKGNQVFPIRATACYEYRTVVQSDYCVLDNFLTTVDNPICSPKSTRSAENSGAPVHVTSVTQSVGGKNKIILNFKIDKVGGGNLYLGDKDLLDDGDSPCDPSFSNKNRVKVFVDTGLGLPLSCPGLLRFDSDANEGVLLLDAGAAEFTCIVDTPAGVESINSLNVEMYYYVEDSIETSIVVKHLLE